MVATRLDGSTTDDLAADAEELNSGWDDSFDVDEELLSEHSTTADNNSNEPSGAVTVGAPTNESDETVPTDTSAIAATTIPIQLTVPPRPSGGRHSSSDCKVVHGEGERKANTNSATDGDPSSLLSTISVVDDGEENFEEIMRKRSRVSSYNVYIDFF